MHHAYLYIGAFKDVLKHLPSEDQVPGPDVRHEVYERFGIVEARMLKETSSLRPVANMHRAFVLTCTSITLEAQNALLKLFEDPVGNVRFHLIIPHSDMLLSTLSSRLMRVETESAARDAGVTHDFLRLSYSDRLTEVASRTKEKDAAWMGNLLSGVEVWALAQKDTGILHEVTFVRKYEHNKSASKKMLLEHLALSLPVVP